MENEENFLLSHYIMTPNDFWKLKENQKKLKYKIANKVVTRDDLSKQIKFELSLLNACRLKVKKLKKRDSEFQTDILITFANRINDMFIILFNLFKFSEIMISNYIKFSRRNEYVPIKCMNVLDELTSKYNEDPDVYISSARYAFNDCNDITKARCILSRGIKFHAEVQKLYVEEFWLEVQYMYGTEDSTALDKYNNYIKLFNDDMHFHFSLVDIMLMFISITELHCIVFRDMVNKYKHSEFMWKTLAKMHLKGFTFNYESQNINYCQDNLQCISNCFGTYEKVFEENLLGIEQIKGLWDLYLEETIEMIDSPLVNNSIIEDFVKNKVQQIFDRACTEKTIRKADYYIFWARYSKDNELNILKDSLKVLPENLKLWKELIMYYAFREGYGGIMETLDSAIKVLQTDSLPLWTMGETFMLNSDDCAAEQFYRRIAIDEPGYPELTAEFRLKYLEWRTIRYGIKSGRAIFRILRRLEPKSLELYQQMISYETDYNCAKNNDLLVIRRLYTRACNEFGRDYLDIWIQCMRFEYGKKFPLLAQMVYDIARDFLNPSLYETLGRIKKRLDFEYSDEIIEIEDD